MTFINMFSNFNRDYFSGMSWNFMPVFPCFNMPSFFNLNPFIPNFTFQNFYSGWNMPYTWNFSSPAFNIFNTLFQLPEFKLNNTSNIWETPSYAKNKSTSGTSGDTFTLSNTYKKGFYIKNYDAKAGEKLAKTALKNQIGFDNKCATYVKNAIQECGLGTYENGHGYQMAGILRKNSNFKEISPSSINVKDLPAGCVLVYGKGVAGYSSEYGHTEITTGDGRAVSDGITKNLRKTPSAIFVPVDTSTA